MEVNEILQLESVEIYPIDSLDVRVYVTATCDTSEGLALLETVINYCPSEWPADEQFDPTTGEPNASQIQWLNALADWQTVPNEDF